MTQQSTDRTGSNASWRTAANIALGILAISLCARISVPIGGYVLLGTIGAPVFADGAGGVDSLLGPTGGYLVGFVLGAAVSGLPMAVERLRGGLGAFGAAVAAHVVILAFGWVRLAAMVGAGVAFSSGVAPFLIGGLVKAAVAAIVWVRFLAPLHPVER